MRLNGVELTEAKEAMIRVGGLSEPSKMPCYSYSLPATACKLGSILVKIAGTTCSGCYALKGRYRMPYVKAALDRRIANISTETWVDDMIKVIRWKEKSGYFRWHDSGDLQGVWHLEKIVAVCRALPEIRFWLPTREYGIVKDYFEKYGLFPSNLLIRLSATKIDSVVPNLLGLTTSGVSNDPLKVTCRAPEQDNQCGSCRSCWKESVKQVVYKQH
jgi:hypothetical protein